MERDDSPRSSHAIRKMKLGITRLEFTGRALSSDSVQEAVIKPAIGVVNGANHCSCEPGFYMFWW